jgi:hypothetical protein
MIDLAILVHNYSVRYASYILIEIISSGVFFVRAARRDNRWAQRGNNPVTFAEDVVRARARACHDIDTTNQSFIQHTTYNIHTHRVHTESIGSTRSNVACARP